VAACLAAEREVAAESGLRPLYVPNLIGTPETVFRQVAFAQARGARAVMVSPMLIGLPAFWELCHVRAAVPVLAHPSFAGAQRIAADVLFGKLFRLYGADAVIFVNFGSRFEVDRDRCRRLADNLVAPWAGVLPSLPVPGGGIDVASAAAVAAFYGRDSMLLVGGNLQVEADAIAQRSRAFVEAVRASG
jgi:ribulose-bisphosphate carboxylase large chain